MSARAPSGTFQFDSVRPSDDVASIPLASIIDGYLTTYAAGEGHTARAKRLDSEKFLRFLKRHRKSKSIEELEVRQWDPSSTQHFVDDCLKQGEAPATVSRRLATLKHMGRVLAERMPGFVNPAREVKSPKLQTLRPKSVSNKEIEKVLERAADLRSEKGSFHQLRNETLVLLLLSTGLRAEEIRTLRFEQLNEQLEWIEEVRTKGRRFRNVYLPKSIQPLLTRYLAARETEIKRVIPNISRGVSGKLPLFVSTHGANANEPQSFLMGSKSVWRAVRACSVDTRLHPHLLRHTFATELLDSSHDIRLVAQALGHSDVRITMRYTERTNEDVAEAIERQSKRKK